ncbi:MAG: translation initiation factor IF-3 [Candidatus Bostrichicola ureolyticus]|nr:MAG: translation initiation factor IF-3 [Candidatus Bostrichicola ureolyticus]
MYRINQYIVAPKVRLVGENIKVGIYTLKNALQIAKNKELDLVEINSKIDPPICKILEYKKFLYEQKKKQKLIKLKQYKVFTKEIRIGPQTNIHDIEFKIKNAKKFLKSKEKVKISILFKGRSIIYKDHGKVILLKFSDALNLYGKVEQMPMMDGKKMYMIISPTKHYNDKIEK